MDQSARKISFVCDPDNKSGRGQNYKKLHLLLGSLLYYYSRFALDKSLIKGNYSPLCFEDLCIEFSAESLYGMYSSFFPYSSPPFAKDFSLRDGLLEVV